MGFGCLCCGGNSQSGVDDRPPRSSMKDLKSGALESHNYYRSKHGAAALKWSNKLASNAQKWAENLAKKGALAHASQREEGENIAFMFGQELSGEKATDMWYDEVKKYNFNKPGFASGTGHFTQVVWMESRELGVGKATSPDGKQFIVARYFPPGNMLGSFPANVKPAGSKVTRRQDPSGATENKPLRKAANESSADDKPQNERQFKNDLLSSHNKKRQTHGSSNLKWSSHLEKEARKAAEEAAETNTLRPVKLDNVGQNMAAMTGGQLSGSKVTDMWYEEGSSYNYSSPGFSSSTGSFTQMVWADSKEIGAGRAFGKSGQTFVVALYSPAGNVRGRYEQNVHRGTGGSASSSKCTIL